MAKKRFTDEELRDTKVPQDEFNGSIKQLFNKETRMTQPIINKITINNIDLDLLAAQLTNAYCSALVLKQLQGVELTQQVKDEIMAKVLEQWDAIRSNLQPPA